MVVGFSEVLDWFSKLGGFAGLWAAWRIYRDGIPQVRSELRPKLYSKTHPDQMDLILRFYPGSRPVTIHSIELPEFDISIVTPDPVDECARHDVGESRFSRGAVEVDWRIPPASEHPEPVETALIISRFNLNSLETISLRVILRTKSIPFRICHDKFQMCSVNKNSPVSPAKRTTRVGIFDVTQNGRGRGPWVDLPWGGAKPLPKPF